METKFLDTSVADVLVPGTGAVETSLVLIAQGDGESDRDGRVCWVSGVDILGSVKLSGQEAETAVQSGDVIRVMLVKDKQANSAVFTVADVLTSAEVFSHILPSKSTRFEVLWDQMFSLNYSANAEGDYPGVVKAFSVSCDLEMKLMFKSGNGDIDALVSNNLAVLAITQNGKTGLQFIARVLFEG